MQVKGNIVVASLIQAVDITDVFEEGDILQWVKRHYDPDDVYTEEDLKEWVRNGYSPEDVYPEDELRAWAHEADMVEVE